MIIGAVQIHQRFSEVPIHDSGREIAIYSTMLCYLIHNIDIKMVVSGHVWRSFSCFQTMLTETGYTILQTSFIVIFACTFPIKPLVGACRISLVALEGIQNIVDKR